MLAKSCSTCGDIKTVDNFEPDPRYRSGYRSQCIRCRVSKSSENNVRLAGHLRRKYGLSLDDWNQRMLEQNSVCAICNLPETRITKPNAEKYISGFEPRLSVDHDHETGQVRGLLCYKCNIGIGQLQDSIANLEAAILYLKKWKNK